MTMDVVNDIVEKSLDLPVLPFPGISFGIIGELNGWNLRHGNSIENTHFPSDVCKIHNHITMSGFNSPVLYFAIWKKLKNVKFLRNCHDPDLDLVLNFAPDKDYLEKSLQLVHDHPQTCYVNGHKEDIFKTFGKRNAAENG